MDIEAVYGGSGLREDGAQWGSSRCGDGRSGWCEVDRVRYVRSKRRQMRRPMITRQSGALWLGSWLVITAQASAVDE